MEKLTKDPGPDRIQGIPDKEKAVTFSHHPQERTWMEKVHVPRGNQPTIEDLTPPTSPTAAWVPVPAPEKSAPVSAAPATSSGEKPQQK